MPWQLAQLFERVADALEIPLVRVNELAGHVPLQHVKEFFDGRVVGLQMPDAGLPVRRKNRGARNRDRK